MDGGSQRFLADRVLKRGSWEARGGGSCATCLLGTGGRFFKWGDAYCYLWHLASWASSWHWEETRCVPPAGNTAQSSDRAQLINYNLPGLFRGTTSIHHCNSLAQTSNVPLLQFLDNIPPKVSIDLPIFFTPAQFVSLSSAFLSVVSHSAHNLTCVRMQ